MAGRLTDEEMNQLETWIGSGSKAFSLLYSITRDACDPAAFHRLCDNQGPTVTVLYNTQGSVFGGYTSASWDIAKGGYIPDDKAFLFQLRYSTNRKCTKFPVKQPELAVYSSKTHGPCFGKGASDLATFFDKLINHNDGVFALNGNMINFGMTFERMGVHTQEINNGHMNITDLKVYSVTDGARTRKNTSSSGNSHPVWRKLPEWSDKFLAKLKDEVTIAKPLVGLDVSHFRFLLLGPIGSGKSSFINTVNAAISGRVTQRASCGTSHHSVTTTYTPYTYRNCSGSSLHLKLCDTPGLEPTQGIDVTDCRFLLNGHVPEFYTFNPSVHFGLDSHEFRVKSTADAKVHCAVFVIDASTVDHMSEKLVDTMTSFKKIMFEKGVPQAVLLTKIDTVSDTVDEDVSRVFNCADIEQKVKKASEVLGLPRNSVFPVKNYEHEIDGDRNVDILALVALRQLLYFAMDYLENQKMQQNKTGDSVRLQCGLWCVPAKKR